MEQNTPKFRLRLNLFDGIVLLIVLAVGAVVLWTALKPQAPAANASVCPRGPASLSSRGTS